MPPNIACSRILAKLYRLAPAMCDHEIAIVSTELRTADLYLVTFSSVSYPLGNFQYERGLG